MGQQAEQTNHEIQLPSLRNWGNDKWRDNAECKGQGTEMFFPTHDLLEGLTRGQRIARRKSQPEKKTLSHARLLCVKCSVRKECLAFAVENSIVHGMYGGKSPKERRGLDLNNLNAGIPVSVVLRELHAVRRAQGRDHKATLAKDLAYVINRSVHAAQEILRNNDLTKIV